MARAVERTGASICMNDDFPRGPRAAAAATVKSIGNRVQMICRNQLNDTQKQLSPYPPRRPTELEGAASGRGATCAKCCIIQKPTNKAVCPAAPQAKLSPQQQRRLNHIYPFSMPFLSLDRALLNPGKTHLL